MASKKMTRSDKIEKNLKALAGVRKNLKAFDSIVETLKGNDDAIAKVAGVRLQLQTDADYLVESTCRQGYMMIVEANKVESFINALPTILKA